MDQWFRNARQAPIKARTEPLFVFLFPLIRGGTIHVTLQVRTLRGTTIIDFLLRSEQISPRRLASTPAPSPHVTDGEASEAMPIGPNATRLGEAMIAET